MKKNLVRIVVIIVIMMLQSGITFAVNTGSVLLEPEPGWKRVDDRASEISYDESFKDYKDSKFYSETLKVADLGENRVVKFNFTGDKFRFISGYYPTYPSDVKIFIDGVEDKVIVNSKSQQAPSIVYSAKNLEDKEHSVVITQVSGAGASYGLIIDAFDISEDGELLPYSENIDKHKILNLESEKTNVSVGDKVSINLVIDNIQEIAAEDVIIEYDAERLTFIENVEMDGIKLLHSTEDKNKLRIMLASKGKINIINEKTILLKLEFQSKKTGKALIDIIRGRVADGIALEKDLSLSECGEITVIIEGKKDVDKSGEFTLLDVSIDARHLGEDPSSSELQDYNTDIVINGSIDEADLLELSKLVRENKNYQFNDY